MEETKASKDESGQYTEPKDDESYRAPKLSTNNPWNWRECAYDSIKFYDYKEIARHIIATGHNKFYVVSVKKSE